MQALIDRSTSDLASALRADGRARGWMTVTGSGAGARVRASCPTLQRVADDLVGASADLDGHAGIFLAASEETGTLFGAFVHRLRRGQGQGGLRFWPYPSVGAFLNDGIRLSRGMSRKSALAGLWWGGGKGIIDRPAGDGWRDPARRERIYAEYARFVTSLRGCYLTAVDAGTTAADMHTVHRHTRFASCIPPELGGSGNPSAMTARGVVCAIEAALEHMGRGDLAGQHIAMQGCGNVGSHMIELLLARDVEHVLVEELSPEQRHVLEDRFGDAPVTVRPADPNDPAILREPCDVLVPNGLGGVLDDKTIPDIRAPLVCGAANNQLADERRHARALADRGIVWVPDYLANRMGIVACGDEAAGFLPDDPLIERHLGREYEGSIHATTRRVLEAAEREDTTPLEAADRLADAAIEAPHPIFGDRAERIVAALIEGGWERG